MGLFGPRYRNKKSQIGLKEPVEMVKFLERKDQSHKKYQKSLDKAQNSSKLSRIH
jgi:hypothetical protein